MNIQAKREAYQRRHQELVKYQAKLEAELNKVTASLIATEGALKVLDELEQESATAMVDAPGDSKSGGGDA